MITLSYGYRLPENKDFDFWPHLEFNIQRLAEHKHDGSDSAKIPTYNLKDATVDVLKENWVESNGVYSQTITIPVGYSPITSRIIFKATEGLLDNQVVNCDYSVSGAETITVFSLDNTYNMKAYIL
ncbi:hypothetical protein [Flavobacterium alkalisoli]|uniref:hypothetical protein n=1 Tax=Flavobacterium alkalisoli TaxID=2602769 RepID=UPI003A8DA9AB